MSERVRPEATLRALADLANHLAATWPAYEATEAALGAATMRATGSDSGHGGDTPDPVAGQAFSHIRYHATVANVRAAVSYLWDAQRTVSNVRRQQPELAREYDAAVKASRCSGEWDPTCTRHAVRGGLCWRCYQARRAFAALLAQQREQG